MRRGTFCCRRNFTIGPACALSTLFSGRESLHIFHLRSRFSAALRNLLAESSRNLGVTVHNGGTYVNMDGPAFSTRAESELNRRHGFDVIGMTNLPEAKLAREAEISLATMAMITDYDCWKVEEEPVSAQTVFGHLMANAETARKVACRCNPASAVGVELAGTFRAGHGIGHRSEALARSDHQETGAASGALPVELLKIDNCDLGEYCCGEC